MFVQAWFGSMNLLKSVVETNRLPPMSAEGSFLPRTPRSIHRYTVAVLTQRDFARLVTDIRSWSESHIHLHLSATRNETYETRANIRIVTTTNEVLCYNDFRCSSTGEDALPAVGGSGRKSRQEPVLSVGD